MITGSYWFAAIFARTRIWACCLSSNCFSNVCYRGLFCVRSADHHDSTVLSALASELLKFAWWSVQIWSLESEASLDSFREGSYIRRSINAIVWNNWRSAIVIPTRTFLLSLNIVYFGHWPCHNRRWPWSMFWAVIVQSFGICGRLKSWSCAAFLSPMLALLHQLVVRMAILISLDEMWLEWKQTGKRLEIKLDKNGNCSNFPKRGLKHNFQDWVLKKYLKLTESHQYQISRFVRKV